MAKKTPVELIKTVPEAIAEGKPSEHTYSTVSEVMAKDKPGERTYPTISEAITEDKPGEYAYSTVLWKLENLGYFEPSFHPLEICSPEFRLTNLNLCNAWKLSLSPQGDKSRGKDHDFYFCLLPSDFVERVSFVCEWSVLDGEASAILAMVLLYHTTNEYSCHDLPEYPAFDEVFVSQRSSYLPNETLTIKLRIRNTDWAMGPYEQLSAITRIWVQKESFEWVIRKFSTLKLDEEIVITLKLGADLLMFSFALKGESLDTANVKISIFAKNCTSTHFIRLGICLTDDKDDENFMEWANTFNSSVREQTWVLPDFVSRRELLEMRHDGMDCDDLTIFCDLTAFPLRLPLKLIDRSFCGPESYLPDYLKNDGNKAEMTVGKSNLLASSGSDRSCNREGCKSLAALSEDLLTSFSKKIMCDFELLSGDTSFHVHKIVLSARSPVFMDMFCGRTKNTSKVLDIPDVDVHTLGRFLIFLYGGTIEDLQWENAAKLFYAADKYQVSSLKQRCRSILRSNVTVSNVPEILELADRHKDQELMSSVHDFIQEHFDAVVISDEWDRFTERSVLAGKTMKEVYKKRLRQNLSSSIPK